MIHITTPPPRLRCRRSPPHALPPHRLRGPPPDPMCCRRPAVEIQLPCWQSRFELDPARDVVDSSDYSPAPGCVVGGFHFPVSPFPTRIDDGQSLRSARSSWSKGDVTTSCQPYWLLVDHVRVVKRLTGGEIGGWKTGRLVGGTTGARVRRPRSDGRMQLNPAGSEFRVDETGIGWQRLGQGQFPKRYSRQSRPSSRWCLRSHRSGR
jgi:hypothetical protein